jgi:abortive infection bacteriophage resistance protein
MEYTKPPISIEAQIRKLKARGLIIEDENTAASYLTVISYYRLRAYTYPFQDNKDKTQDHRFRKEGIRLEDIMDLYRFDSELRSLIFRAIEKIEVAFRTGLVYIYSMETKSGYWYIDRTFFDDIPSSKTPTKSQYDELYEKICTEVERSRETFIKHYQEKYSVPKIPPAWMALEVSSFGSLSRLYELLKRSDVKKLVAKEFGLTEISILENWLRAISVLRNSCAHHSRIWNKRFAVKIKLPYNTLRDFLDAEIKNTVRNDSLFAVLCCIQYLLGCIDNQNGFAQDLQRIITGGGRLVSVKSMGFPACWQELSLWSPLNPPTMP